ncbi:MAG: hypothetical protein ACQER9_01230 [Nanobdellota archaeon]
MRPVKKNFFVEDSKNIDRYSGKRVLVNKLNETFNDYAVYFPPDSKENEMQTETHLWEFPERPLMYFELSVHRINDGNFPEDLRETCLGTLYYAECSDDNPDLHEARNRLYNVNLIDKIK